METKKAINKPKVDKSSEKTPATKKKTQKIKFKKGEEVYLSAFLKQEKGVYYMCKGIIETVPGLNERQIYKVKIVAVADRSIGGPKVVHQARLLGLVCSKRARELNNQLPGFMTPKNWIEKVPKDQKYRGKPK